MIKISETINRIKTKEFWKEVGYWSAIKWSGKKTQPIAKEDWLPMLTSAFLGFFLIFLIFLVVVFYKIFAK